MKMKKVVSIAVTAALLVSMAATAAFAVESTPSKTASDADAGKTETSVSGTDGENLNVEVKVTEDSEKEESKLKNQGVEGYLGTKTTEAAAKSLGASKDNLTVSEIKEVKVTDYTGKMGAVTLSVPFAALPEEGTPVAVIVRVTTSDGKTVSLPVTGTVVETTVYVNGVAKKVRRVVFTLDAITMANVQAGKVYVAAVTKK